MTQHTSLDGLRIDGDRLWHSLMELARIGATPKGGVCRLALTDLDRQGRDLVVGWAREAGLSVTVDQIGNVFMRRAGRNPTLPPVVTGSHIDTQPTGGKFDGNYGVLAGLEVVRTLNDRGIETEAPIEVVFWTNEEGSRFVPVMMGSGVFAGAFTLEYALRREGRRRQDRAATNSPHRLHAATRRRASTRSAPISRRTSSRARCWKTHDKTIGVVPGVHGPALVRLHGDRHGGARRAHADGAAPRRAARRRRASCRRWWRSRTATRRTAAARSAWCRCSRTAAT